LLVFDARPENIQFLKENIMSADAAKYFNPEHLAMWRRITRGYLFAPIDSLNCRGQCFR